MMNILTSEIDFDKIRKGKIEAADRFKEVFDKAIAEGFIEYKPIRFKSSNEPLYGVLCG